MSIPLCCGTRLRPRGISARKRGEQSPAAGDQPHLVAVPDRPDRIQKQAPVLVFPDKQMENSNTQVEAVQHGIAGEEDSDEDIPDRVEVGDVHARGVVRTRAFQLSGISSLSSSSSGP